MQNALCYKCQHMDEYIKFISHFGPALTGMSFWNNNKTSKLVSELLTITDEAFIHLCIINYSATWKAQELTVFIHPVSLEAKRALHNVRSCIDTIFVNPSFSRGL